LACVPSIARAHDKLSADRTPAQEHSRFRWTNSCESVPKKVTTVVLVAPVEAPAQVTVEPPARTWRDALASDRPPIVPSPVPFPLGLRAPPASA
jgi:hypothetical protein